jgi:sugar-specific transcriptional regulator TrmB
VSKVSKVSRQDTYRIISTLQKLGLVERGTYRASNFKAVSLKEGLAICFNARKKNSKEPNRKWRSFLKDSKNKESTGFLRRRATIYVNSGRERIASVLSTDIIILNAALTLAVFGSFSGNTF